MTKYIDLKDDEKNSITLFLRDLFEEREEFVKKKEFISYSIRVEKIKGFQEGEKLAIKIIDEEIEWLISNTNNGYSEDCLCRNCVRTKELKKQREHLKLESELE